MSFPPHEWGPDTAAPGHTRCLWCRRTFILAGGTHCEITDRARASMIGDTVPIPAVAEPQPRIRLYWVALTLLVAWMVTVAAAALAADTPHTNPPVPTCGNGRAVDTANTAQCDRRPHPR